jgi:predicted ABC-type ATPase
MLKFNDIFNMAKINTMVCTYNLNITHIRDLFHEKILKKYHKTIIYDKQKWFIFTAGCFGSGKSHVMQYLHTMKKIDLNDYIFVDPDELRYEIPEIQDYIKKDPYTVGEKTHDEACYLADLLIAISLYENNNIISDGSMQNYFWYQNSFIPYLRKNYPTYKIAIIYVKADLDIVLERCKKRGENTGRMIKEDIIKSTYDKVKISYDKLAPLVDFSCIIDNNLEPQIDKIDFPF